MMLYDASIFIKIFQVVLFVCFYLLLGPRFFQVLITCNVLPRYSYKFVNN